MHFTSRRPAPSGVAVAALACAALLFASNAAQAVELTLEQTRELARAAAFDVDVMQARVDALEATQHEAGAALRPRVQVTGQFEQRDRQVELDLPDIPGFDIGTPVVMPGSQARVVVEFDAPVVNLDGWRRVRAAREQVAAGQAQQDVVIDQIELAAIELHIGILSLGAALEVAENRQALAQAQSDFIGQRVEVGMATEFALRRAQTEVIAAQIQVEETERARAEALRMLGALLGGEDVTQVFAPDVTQAVGPGGAGGSLQATSLNDHIANALRARSEMLVHDQTLRALESAESAERLGLVPDLIVTGQAGTSTAEAIDGEHGQWALQANLVWVPYDRGQRRARQSRVEAQAAGQEAELARTRTTIEREVTDAWYALESARATVALAEEQERLASEAVRLAEAARDAGAATSLDVLEAQAVYVGAQTQRVSAAHRRDVAAWRLAWATGAL